MLLDALEGAGVDLFICNINISWFARKNTLEHPALIKLGDGQAGLDLPGLGLEPEKPTITPPEAQLSGYMLNHWKLYRYRVLLNYWLFGKPLREKIEDAVKEPRPAPPLRRGKAAGSA